MKHYIIDVPQDRNLWRGFYPGWDDYVNVRFNKQLVRILSQNGDRVRVRLVDKKSYEFSEPWDTAWIYKDWLVPNHGNQLELPFTE